MIRIRTLVCILGILLIAAPLAIGADQEALDASRAKASSLRTFAPVQGGFTTQGKTVLPYAPDRLLVQFKADIMNKTNGLNISLDRGTQVPGERIGIDSIDQLAAEAGVVSVERPYIRAGNAEKAAVAGTDLWFMYKFDNADDLADLAARFRGDKAVQAVSFDWIAYPAAVPNDPMYPDHWGHNNTAQMISYNWSTYSHDGPTVGTVGFDANAPGAWDVTYGSSSVVIAIIDSGVDVGHPDLNQVAGYDYGDNDSNADDDAADAGHGTSCAGIAAGIANNGQGTAGIAGGCSIMPLKIANSAGSMYFSAIQNALYHAADNGADIISMSLGAPISSDAATDAAIQYAYNAGCVILAATGNENMSTISYPAINQYVMAVGAASPCGERKRSSSSSTECNPGVDTDPNGYTCDGERWWGSNYGVTTKDAAGAVDVLAPTILPTTDIQGSGGYNSGDYDGFFNGTSCSTPYAAGVAALIKSQNPSWTPAQIRDQIVNTAQDVTSVESGTGWDRYAGYGMVDAEAALGGGTPSEDPPVAAFTGSPTSGVAPLSVSFSDQSAYAPTSWNWNFGDGATSTAQNPSHTYSNPGDYTVSLTVTNAYGSDSETKTNYISVADPADTYATPPYAMGFEGGAVDQYWTLYEGAEGRIEITTANSPHSGSYHMVMDDYYNGGSYSQNEAWLQLNLAGQGQVDLDFWWTDYSDETHSQDGVYLSDNGGASFVKVLDLNGASYTNGVWRQFNIDVTAAAASAGLDLTGTFVVKFQQYDNYEATTDGMAFDDISVSSGVVLNPPVAAFIGTPTSGDYPLAVQFTDQSTNDPTSWSWTFGDGGTSTAQNPSHTYNAAGTYTVALTATNGDGSDVETKTGYIVVTEPTVPTPPVAAFSGTPTSGDYPLAVQFTDASTNNPTSWSWTFGDGGTSMAQNPNHTYTAAGTYTVVLTATNEYGSDGETKSGYITVTEPPVGGTMHVEDIVVTAVQSGRKYYGRAVVTILDNTGAPVSGAAVTGIITGDVTQTLSGTTGTDGTVTLQTSRKYYANNDFCFEVTNVTHATLNYDSGANLVTKSCEGGDVYGASSRRVTEYVLEQNAPNPFNPMTEIAFSLPAEGHARLVVYNVKGQIVDVLADGTYGIGTHSVMWDARDNATGVYFYSLEAPGYSETRKMILLK